MNKIIIFIVLGLFALISFKLFASNNDNIVVHHGKYSDYYHIKYELKKDNFLMAKDAIFDNGQFEIYLDKNKFPIPARNCKRKLILRMPSTLSNLETTRKDIQKKVSLYKKIKKIFESGKGSIDVIIELNPYVIIKSKNPLELELENCNIFFRTNKNSYVDTL